MMQMLRLTIRGQSSTDMLLRVVNLLAQRGLVPHALRASARGEAMVIRMRVALHSGPMVAAMVEKLRAIIGVASVVAEEVKPVRAAVARRPASAGSRERHAFSLAAPPL
jgi:acetolactate synthase regulatory subunit